jgi:predicted nucleotide-binding protein
LKDKRILFYGSLAPDAPQEVTREICRELGTEVVNHGYCLTLSGPGELDLVVADAVHRRCGETGAAIAEHLEWVMAHSTSTSDHPQLRLGRRVVLDDAYSYGSFARLRTYQIDLVEAVVTVGGGKGVFDIVEKAKLARKPFYPIATTGGESRAQWAAVRPDDAWFCSPGQFEDLADLNLTAADLVSRIFTGLNSYWQPDVPRVFIVHGHDGALKYELKDYIQNTLRLGEPIILQDEPSSGRTIMEKFEDYAAGSNVAFVLFTPDDYVAASGDSNEQRWRGRQNVVLELGYFLGKWTRRSGRVIVLHKGGIEIPSDIAGLTYIAVDGGIAAAGEQIRRELREWLPEQS